MIKTGIKSSMPMLRHGSFSNKRSGISLILKMSLFWPGISSGEELESPST